METLEYFSIEQQIEKLKSQHLIIDDVEFAKYMLSTHGYYSIINGYRGPYIFTNENNEKEYRPNVTFEQIYDLFIFDKEIRDGIMTAMIDFEEHLKATVADILGESFGVNPNDYLARNNYRDKEVSNPAFRRNEILYTLTKSVRYSQKDPIKHYRDTYGIVPPWILFKDTYFATIVNLVKFLKKPEREKLIRRLYSDDISDNDMDSYKDLLSDTLFICLDYRNRTAHGGRIYSYIPKSSLRPFMDNELDPGLPQLLFALENFKYSDPYRRLHSAISSAINNYCLRHHSEEDVERIELVTSFKLTRSTYLYVNPKTKVIHKDSHCSGASNLELIKFEDITSEHTPCKRCLSSAYNNS